MGKKQNSKDKIALTVSEHAALWGGKESEGVQIPFKKLPLNCCSLSLQKFDQPVCVRGTTSASADGANSTTMNVGYVFE